jgi:hypothetical protein
MGEPTAALSYADLVLAVAIKANVAYYGPDGNQQAQIPVEAFDLAECTRMVQNGVRMFMADAPPTGWRWQRPLAEIDLWPEKGIAMPPGSAGPNLVTAIYDGVSKTVVTATSAWFNASQVGLVLAVRATGLFTITDFVTSTSVKVAGNVAWMGGQTFLVQDPTGAPTMTASYSGTTLLTTITAPAGTFYPSTEGKTLFITDKAASITLLRYLTDSTMTVQGDVTWAAPAARTFNLSSQGTYALPQNFGGEVTGEITYQAGSNRGVPITWTSELELRRLRENWNSVSGNPYYAAVRLNNSVPRRWDLLVYPNTGGTYRVEFPFILYFDKITDLSDMHPAGFQHDDAVLAACLAALEMRGDELGTWVQDYRQRALPNSYKIDARSASRRLGYNGNPRAVNVALKDFRSFFRRPTVGYRS